jgi:hypothetical protein
MDFFLIFFGMQGLPLYLRRQSAVFHINHFPSGIRISRGNVLMGVFEPIAAQHSSTVFSGKKRQMFEKKLD